MRYYRIDIVNIATGQPMLPTSLKGQPISSLMSNGLTNPAALNIELDIPIGYTHAPGDGGAFCKIWGLGLEDIGGAFNLNQSTDPSQTNSSGATIAISAGMSKGLPLARPEQAQQLVKGKIYQAYGNWIGLDQNVDILFKSYGGTQSDPINLVLDWKAGTLLSDALSATFNTAFPSAKQSINISARLKVNHDEQGYHGTLAQFSKTVMDLSKSIIKDPGYQGVRITWDGTTITAYDGLLTSAPVSAEIEILPQDLIGQATWAAPNIVQIKTVMRGDIDMNDTVILPPTLISNQMKAMTAFLGADRNKVTFSGKFRVNKIHHYGNFRAMPGESWCTVFDLQPITQTSPSPGSPTFGQINLGQIPFSTTLAR